MLQRSELRSTETGAMEQNKGRKSEHATSCERIRTKGKIYRQVDTGNALARRVVASGVGSEHLGESLDLLTILS